MNNYFYILLTFIIILLTLVVMKEPSKTYFPFKKGLREIRHTPKDSKLTDIQDISPSDTLKFIFDNGETFILINGELYQ